MPTPSPVVVNLQLGWDQVVVTALIQVAALLLAAAIGAFLGAWWTRKQSFKLHRTNREQEALLRLLDLLAGIDLAMRRSLPGPRDGTVRWSEAVEGIGATFIREHPGVTWDRSDEPDKEFYQWGAVVGAILDTEEEWRGHLRARANRPDIASRWWEILETGAPMGLKGGGAHEPHLEQLHSKVVELMHELRKLT